MDTTWEDPGPSSQWEYVTSPNEKRDLLGMESAPFTDPSDNASNTNVLSPFSSLTSKLASDLSTSNSQNMAESTPDEGSDFEEESLAHGQTLQNNHQDNKRHCQNIELNHPCSSQGSSSKFSPFSSPVSSPRSEAAENTSNATTLPITQPSPKYSGTFLHPGTSTSISVGNRDKTDRVASKKRCFIHPSTSEGVKNGQHCVESTTQDICANTQLRFQSFTKTGRSRNAHLLQKIMGRELTGVVRKNPSNPRDPYVRLFSRLPARLAFCLRDAIPHSAIENGHIFMGFSKCGQFLLSYTQSEADVDLVTLVPHFHYHYRLHWWLFVPYRKAKKVAEVTLFSNSSAAGNLHISFCQWPKDNKKVLVFGYQIGENIDSMYSTATSAVSSSARPCYITVTAIPSLNACRECVKVAAGYEEDEMAAAWNSCVRLSCLDHGMTVHTCFDLVPPYPKFEPRVSMKRDSWVLINSGNFLHAMHFELEELKPKENSTNVENYNTISGTMNENYQYPRHHSVNHTNNVAISRPPGLTSPQYGHSFALARWSELRISVSEFNAGLPCPAYGNVPPSQYLTHPSYPPVSPYHSHAIFSPTQSQYSPSVHAGGGPSSIATTDSSDCESECSSYTNTHSFSKHKKIPMNPERLERVAKFVEELSPPQLGTTNNPFRARRLKRILLYPSGNTNSRSGSDMSNVDLQGENSFEFKEDGNKRKRLANAADKAYELTDDNFDEDSVQEKLSTFRKKRLAEKKYEFTDEESENIPLPKLRSQHQKIKKQEVKPSARTLDDCDGDEEKNASKTLNANRSVFLSQYTISQLFLNECLATIRYTMIIISFTV